MKRYRVIFARRADIHLAEIHAFVHRRDGPWRAEAAVQHILKACRRLETLPVRGLDRPDLGVGLRSWRATKRATVVFEVAAASKMVVIHGIFTGGRDIDGAFKGH